MRRVPTAPLVAVACLAFTACGGDDPEPAVPAVDRKPETSQRLPKLPRGFEAHITKGNGIALGRPPGWRVTKRGRATVLIAPDELVVLSLSANRSDRALAADPAELATDTFAALEGYRGKLKPSRPRRFGHRYDAYEVRGDARAVKTGVPQRLRVIVLERVGRVVVTAVIASNSRERAPDEVRQAYQALRSLRTRPPGAHGQRSGRSG